MLKKDVKLGDTVRFLYEGSEHTGTVERIDFADTEQVLVGDIVPPIEHETRLVYQARQLRHARV
jgi:plastocyanin